MGKGDGTFWPALTYSAGGTPFAVGDLNGDGRDDLAVVGSFDTNSLRVLLGKSDGTFQTAGSYNAGPWPWSVAAGDFNGDGKLDLAVEAGPSVLLGNGDGTFQAAVSYPVGGIFVESAVSSIVIGDFNREGSPDLATGQIVDVASTVRSSLSVLLNTCSSSRPRLAIARTSNNALTVSWPLPSAGFALESGVGLTPPNWHPVVGVLRTNGSRLEITTPLNASPGFFRLHQN